MDPTNRLSEAGAGISIQDFIAAPSLHLETTNISALKLSKFYKDRGNLNWSFLLHLYDTTLAKINPVTTKHYSPELQARIIAECKRNPWYFFREWCRIPVTGGSVQFEFNRGNVAQLWCCLNSVNFIEMLPRQQGKTQGVIAGINYLEIFVLSNAEITVSNKLLNDSRLNVSRLKNQRELLPAWMRKYDPKKDIDNVDKLFMSVGKNTIKTLSTAKSVNDAERLGRGLTTPIVWFDEFAFLSLNSVIYEAASPAQGRAQEEARKKGMPAFKAITTTPGDLDSVDALYCKAMINDAAAFNEDLYDMTPEQILQYMDDYSANDYVYIEFSYTQLGRDEKWFRTQCRQLNNNALKIKREVLLSWTRTSDSSVFSEEQMDTITKYATIHTSVPSGYKHYKMNIYSERFNINNFMIAGVDVAGGLGKNRDSSAVVFVDPGTSEVLASIHSNKIDTDDLYLMLIYLFSMCPNTIFAIERNSYGLPIIQRLVKNDDYRKRLFHRAANGSDREKVNGDISKSQLTFTGTEDRIYGVDTNTFSRDAMMSILNRALDETPELFRSGEMNKQIQTLQYAKGGKIEHAPGCHDDLIMAYLVACYAMTLTVDFSNSVSESDMQRTKIGENLQNRGMTTTDTKAYNNILDMDQELTKYQSTHIYRESSANNDLRARNRNTDDLANDLFFINSGGYDHSDMQGGFDAINSLNDSDW